MAITKNRQSNESIANMAKKAFPDKQIAEIKELTEGILKIAAKDRSGNTSNEVNLMGAEIRAMKLVAEKCSFKVADIQYYDTGNTICDGNYFFMEKLEGDNFFLIKDSMSEEEIARQSWRDFVMTITEPELIQYLKERQLYVNEEVETEDEEQ